MTDHEAVIRARRAQSNAAIAARDTDATAALMMPDVTVSVAGGPTLSGRDASRNAFAEQFADRAFRGYVREAQQVTVTDPPLQATELGRWEGRWSAGSRTQVMRGTYHAVWRFTDLGWFIESEVFVSER